MAKKQTNPIDAHVGRRLRIRRVLIGMNQGQLGKLLGLTFQQIQKYEKGANRIGAGRLYQIAHILGVPIGYFYEDVVELRLVTRRSSGPTALPVMEFLSEKDGLQLNLAFMRIKDLKVRKSVIELLKSLAGDRED
ncbi:MAG: helix-turn-helix transcriptional regulator [Rhizomicrobium sp.]